MPRFVIALTVDLLSPSALLRDPQKTRVCGPLSARMGR
jgi:hypothetical protein